MEYGNTLEHMKVCGSCPYDSQKTLIVNLLVFSLLKEFSILLK